MTNVSAFPYLNKEWALRLKKEIEHPCFQSLDEFLKKERETRVIYPPNSQVFTALNLLPFAQIKVVILGQDPYHQPGQANGLAFSVAPGVRIPPSLRNIYKELQDDIPGFKIPDHGDLSHWAKQGVLLLNATLTVRQNLPASHQQKGWEQFTDSIIQLIEREKENIVFILWGKAAQAKSPWINPQRHLILKSAHPSPLSAYRGFFGSKIFSKTNAYLEQKGIKPINWQLPEQQFTMNL